MKTQKTYFFLSGLPRSGSTLLAAILSQHPEVFVSVTSPLLDFMGAIEQQWLQTYQSFTCPFENHLQNISQGFLEGFYKEAKSPYIMDKSRGWTANIGKLHELLGEPPKLVCTVRDLPSVLASFYRVIDWEPAGESQVDQSLLAQGKVLNKAHRCQQIWDSLIKSSWASFKQGYTDYRNCIHLVEYDDLLKEPETVLQGIYSFLGIQGHKHDISNIEQPIVEDDSKWGISNLHTIGSKLERQSSPAEDQLGGEIFNTYSQLKLEFWRV